MKLDSDLIREILLKVEASEEPYGPKETEFTALLSKFDSDRIKFAYTINALSKAELIDGSVQYASNEPYFINPGNLTFEGQKYLDNIRDDTVWNAAKETVGTQFKSVSIDIISTVASNIISNALNLK